MLKLCAENSDDVYIFLVNQRYTVGRKNCDISIPCHSVSRNHAHIEVHHPSANIKNPALLPTLRVTDVGSTCGTYLDEQIDMKYGTRIQTLTPVILESRIRFGCELGGQFRLQYTPLVVTWSRMTASSELAESIRLLGGHLVPTWISKCRYVVMDSLILTIQAGCALLAGGYIVSPNFFQDWVNAIERNSKPPEPLDYTPPLAEKSLSSSDFTLQPLPGRAGLFRNKTFLFTENDVMKKFQILVQTGGGNAKMVLECPSSQLGYLDILMIVPSGSLSSLDEATINAVYTYKRSGKRLIPISGLCLAILYARMDKECNPYYKLPSKKSAENQSSPTELMESEIHVVPEIPSPSPTRPSRNTSEITMVPESPPSPLSSSTTTKATTTTTSRIRTTSRSNTYVIESPTITVYRGRPPGRANVSNNNHVSMGGLRRNEQSLCSRRKCDAHNYSGYDTDDSVEEEEEEGSNDNFATFNINQSVHTRVRVRENSNHHGTTNNNRKYRY